MAQSLVNMAQRDVKAVIEWQRAGGEEKRGRGLNKGKKTVNIIYGLSSLVQGLFMKECAMSCTGV